MPTLHHRSPGHQVGQAQSTLGEAVPAVLDHLLNPRVSFYSEGSEALALLSGEAVGAQP